MDIKQLINFITIVEEGNITKAAQNYTYLNRL